MLSQLTQYPFMVNALEAAGIVAVLSAVVGWFTVLRRQTFIGHSLSVMAFPGAAAGALLGLPGALGYYAACGGFALVLPRRGGRGGGGGGGSSGESAAVGVAQSAGLALGFLFLSLYGGVLVDLENMLFGTYLGITRGQVLALLVVAAGALALLALLARPLTFATIDPLLARAHGVRVGLLDLAFLLILAVTVAATSQITGALLVFSLLVGPPATAAQLTARPLRALAISVVLGVAIAWTSLAVAYFHPSVPVGFLMSTLAFAAYLAARLLTR